MNDLGAGCNLTGKSDYEALKCLRANSLKAIPTVSQVVGDGSVLKGQDGNLSKRDSADTKFFHLRLTASKLKEEDLVGRLKSMKTKRIACQLEKGENGILHYQITIEFDRPIRRSTVRNKFKEFDFPNKDYCEKCISPEDSLRYCEKDDTKVKEILMKGIPKPITIIRELKKWQSDLVDIIKKEPDDRLIYWVLDKVGGKGKSVFCKYLWKHHSTILLSGKGNDMKYGIVKYQEKTGVYPELIIIDVPRSNLEFLNYTAIEEIKNGLFFSSKYESDMVCMNSPHIIIFANEYPKINNLSLDRWRISEDLGLSEDLVFNKISDL